MGYSDPTLHPCLIYSLQTVPPTAVTAQLRDYCHSVTVSKDYTNGRCRLRLSGVHNLRHRLFIEVILGEYRV